MQSEKTSKIEEQFLQYWKVGLLPCYTPRSQNTLHGGTFFETSKTASIHSLELEDTRNLWKKLIESE